MHWRPGPPALIIAADLDSPLLQVWDVRTRKLHVDLPGHADEVRRALVALVLPMVLREWPTLQVTLVVIITCSRRFSASTGARTPGASRRAARTASSSSGGTDHLCSRGLVLNSVPCTASSSRHAQPRCARRGPSGLAVRIRIEAEPFCLGVRHAELFLRGFFALNSTGGTCVSWREGGVTEESKRKKREKGQRLEGPRLGARTLAAAPSSLELEPTHTRTQRSTRAQPERSGEQAGREEPRR